MKNISCIGVRPDGTLYFVAEASPQNEKKIGRFMECLVEYDEEKDQFRLTANDSVLAEF